MLTHLFLQNYFYSDWYGVCHSGMLTHPFFRGGELRFLKQFSYCGMLTHLHR